MLYIKLKSQKEEEEIVYKYSKDEKEKKTINNTKPAIISSSEEYTDVKNSLTKYKTLIKLIEKNLEELYENFESIDGRILNKY